MRVPINLPLVALVLGVVLCIQPAIAAQVPPFELIRTLQRVQDQIARGSVQAHRAQVKLISHIAERFMRADTAAWREPRNLQALASFLLSGGNPAIGRRVLESGIEDETHQNLIKAALAYGEGRQSHATRLFGSIDPLSLPPSIGGHVALVKAALFQSSDHQKSLVNLELARLLLPGTLIEEAALRRAMVAAGNHNQLGKFEVFAGQYLKRFNQSVYAAEFDAKFSQQIVRLPYLREQSKRRRFEGFVSTMSPERQLPLLLLVARNAVVAGKHDEALFVVERLEKLAEVDSPAHRRAVLYRAAAQVTRQPASARQQLHKVKANALPYVDRQIVAAAIDLAEKILEIPGASVEPEIPHPAGSAAWPADDPHNLGSPGGVAATAEQLIQTVDKILQ